MEKTDIIITETGNYEELIPLFRSSGLEIHAEGGKPQNMITCWRADDQRGNLLGGVSIERKKGLFVIGDIAVEREMRRQNIGGCLLGTAMKCIRQMGGRQIYLVAKAPKFFEKFGFVYQDEREAPGIFNCKTCAQRGETCFPEFMIWTEKEQGGR